MEVKKFEQLDSLRFFAVLTVLNAHWRWQYSDNISIVVDAGRVVDLFFVISGFLITLGLLKTKAKAQSACTSLYRFYARRFLRLFPIYYLVIFLVWVFDHTRIAGTVWWYLLYSSNFYSIIHQDWGDIGHLWSLAVEEQFYLVWPLIILLTTKRFMPWVISGSILISILTKTFWVLQKYPFWFGYMHPIGALDALAIGALLSYAYYYHQARLRSFLYSFYTGIAAIFIAAICIYSKDTTFSSFYHIGIRTCFAIFSAWLVGRSVFSFGGIVGYLLNNRVLRYIGTISYGVYLFHAFVPGLIAHFFTLNLFDNQKFIIYFLTTTSLASISWYVFERQILKLKSQFE